MLSSEVTYSTRVELIGLLLALYPLGQFFSASVFGSASDKWGRKNILLITIAGTIIASFL
jgi:MFS family permease